MNKQEINEIKGRLTLDANNVTCIRGCYVNTNRQIVSAFKRSPIEMPQEEAEKYLSIFKKTLSGELGKHIVDISFRAEQVMDSEEHKLLSALNQSALNDDEAAEAFFNKLIDGLSIECNTLILIMHDVYDVPRGKAGLNEEYNISDEVFSYVIACVCPVKMSKPVLSYIARENDFHTRDIDWVVGAPDTGFMFPAFDDRRANIYGAAFFTRDAASGHEDFIQAAFGGDTPMPAQAQKQAFQAILTQALEEECDLELVRNVNDMLLERVEAQKADKTAEIARVGGREVKGMLESMGVSQARADAFEEKYEQEFGKASSVSAVNLIDKKQMELRTPNVIIKVDAAHSDAVETRVIDGIKYILIRADDGVEVNGVNISINPE